MLCHDFPPFSKSGRMNIKFCLSYNTIFLQSQQKIFCCTTHKQSRALVGHPPLIGGRYTQKKHFLPLQDVVEYNNFYCINLSFSEKHLHSQCPKATGQIPGDFRSLILRRSGITTCLE